MASYKVECYTRDRFLNDMNKGNFDFINQALTIISSHEKDEKYTRSDFDKFLSDSYETFSDSKNACGFVLLRDEKPISFVLFENVDFEDNNIAVSMIWTKSGAEGQGYARSLLSYALSYYANNTDCESCRSIIDKNNESSIKIHSYFVNQNKGRLFKMNGKIVCELNVKSFENQKDFVLISSDAFAEQCQDA